MADEYSPNHTCKLCDSEYYSNDYYNKQTGESWRDVCCNSLHYQIYTIVIGVRDNLITAEEAKTKLDELGVTKDDVLSFRENAQNILLSLFDK